MKKVKTILIALCLLGGINSGVQASEFELTPMSSINATSKMDIKLKNDTDDEVTVINDGSGGSYRLQKNVTTTIKMEAGDKLYYYEKGKKGKLLLIASSEMDGKVQLLSKI